MYVPQHFAADDAQIRRLLEGQRAADLVTATATGLVSTFLPLLFDPDRGDRGALLGHVARNNDQWRTPALGEAMVIIRGPGDSYISPSWYATKAEHGRVVPTWNYSTAHVYGRLIVHDDVRWLESLVRRLTDRHEVGRNAPWSVDDAPPKFVAGQLRAIVGVEVVISRVQGKLKLSQNRSPLDVDGVVAGLENGGDPLSAAAVRDVGRSPGTGSGRRTAQA